MHCEFPASKCTTRAEDPTAEDGELFTLNNRTRKWRAHNFWELGNDSPEVFFSDILQVWQEDMPDANPPRN